MLSEFTPLQETLLKGQANGFCFYIQLTDLDGTKHGVETGGKTSNLRGQATRFVFHLIDAILEMSIGMEAKMQKWEYATVRFEGDIEAVDAKVVIHRGRELEERDPKWAGLPNVLAELGDDGWEAITMTHLTKRLITILFKRPLEPETKENNSEKFWEFVRRRKKVQN